MLSIHEHDDSNNYRTLNLSDDLFHKALRAVLKGETRFHVKNHKGEDFDLVYEQNNELLHKQENFFKYYNPLLEVQQVYPPYLTYDEYDDSKIYLKLFEGYDGVWFEEVNEYSVVLAKLLLRKTELKVYFQDARICWFIDENENLRIRADRPDGRIMIVNHEYERLNYELIFDNTWYVSLFHNVFVLQWVTDLPLEQVKYAELTVLKTEGIGSIFTNIVRVGQALDFLGCKVYLKEGSTRYKDELLEKYFNLSAPMPDSNDRNTIYLTTYLPFCLTHFVKSLTPNITTGLLKQDFIRELDDYAEAVLGNKRYLGLLVRGTDYIKLKIGYRTLDLESLIQEIQARLDQYHYDGIFLATEDKDYYEGLVKAFPHKIRTISQVRHRLSDLQKANTLNELEHEQSNSETYDALVEDNTVNYMYAIYMLSKCESFITTPVCLGAVMARGFNGGKFIHDETLSDKNSYK